MATDVPSTDNMSWHARYASIAIRENVASLFNETTLANNFTFDRHTLPAVPESLFKDSDADAPLKVGIVGAGIAGLFTGLLLDYLKQKYGLKVEYEILEAAGEDRLGGRLYSYYFPNGGRHDYYDVGAMRFPDNKIMERTFQLFDICNMKKHTEEECKKKKDDPEFPPKGDLRPYYLSGVNNTTSYNDTTQKTAEAEKKGYSVFGMTGNIPPDFMKPDQTPDGVVENAIKEIVKIFERSPKEGWEYLISEADQYSVRQYLTTVKGYSYDTIEWLETFTSGNRWYDQSFSEMVIEFMDFEVEKGHQFWCIEGGANQLAQRTRKELANPDCISFNSRVTEMTLYDVNKNTQEKGIEATIVNQKTKASEKRKYTAVFNSATLGSMQRMNLAGLNLNYGTKQAIRSLGYGASCKVGIRFNRMWWMEEPFNITEAGLSKTDLPIRVCVYPSYNINDKKDQPGVLLVSYCWSQEAQRLSSLISRDSPKDEDELINTILYDLAKMHTVTTDDGTQNLKELEKRHKLIKDAYETHYAYDWYADPHMAGAFAYFGPGQFRGMYPFIERNDGRHIIIGEVASAHHAWVVGALESAVRGVYQFLVAHQSKNRPDIDAIIKDYDADKIPGPFGPLPQEFSRSEGVKVLEPGKGAPWTAKEANDTKDDSSVPWTNDLAFQGEFLRTQLLFEGIRVETGKDQVTAKTLEQNKDLNNLVVGLVAST